MTIMLCVFPFALVNVLIGKTPGFPPSDSCFRWKETPENNGTLWWEHNGTITYPSNSERNYLDYCLMKSASQFFGGMDQDALMSGKNGAGGFIGTSMSVAGRSSCSVRLGTTRVLVRLPDYYYFSAVVFF